MHDKIIDKCMDNIGDRLEELYGLPVGLTYIIQIDPNDGHYPFGFYYGCGFVDRREDIFDWFEIDDE